MNRGLRRELALLGGLAAVSSYLLGKKTLARILGTACAGLALLPDTPYAFRDRSVIITGGSRGLGLALASQLVQEGAHVTILARDPDELERARLQLLKLSEQAQVLAIRCDMTEPNELGSAVDQVLHEFGRIDVLINNAGNIAVGPFGAMEDEDFDVQLELQLRAVIHAIELVRPIFQQTGGGRIANISSIGGIIPVPHMSTYCAAKFALAGLSESIAAELALENIQITTVYPGLMRTGSPIQAVFKGDCEREYGWFASGDVTPGLSVSAETAARQILDGIRHGDTRVTYPLITKIGILGHAALPATYAFLMRNAARFIMPKSEARERKTGAQSQNWLNQQLWYKPLSSIEKKAEQQLNQQKKYDAEYNLGLLSL
jgi:NAD(P)-dependent dehydrogenase (short-subunit alcohol dehydrogenase family)